MSIPYDHSMGAQKPFLCVGGQDRAACGVVACRVEGTSADDPLWRAVGVRHRQQELDMR